MGMRTADLVCWCQAGKMQQVRQIVELCEQKGNGGRYQKYDVNGEWGRGGTPLCTAIQHGQDEVAKYLISRTTIDINKTGCGWTPLHWACSTGNVEIINVLIGDSRCTSLNTKGNDGITPLMWAVRCGKLASVRALLTVRGMDLNTRDENGKSLKDVARELGPLEMEQLLQN